LPVLHTYLRTGKLTLFMKYSLIAALACVLLISVPVSAQKKNGKVTIEIEKGGVEKGKIKNGQREGVWKSYNSKGQLIQEENFLNGKRNGAYWRKEDSTEVTGNYTANQKNGTFITKVNGKVVSEIAYLFDTLHGKYFFSSKEKTVTGTYDHGRKINLRVVDSTDYYGYRVKDSTMYANGLREGYSVIYRNGVRYSETSWQRGQRNGIYKEYDIQTGKLVSVGYFTDDKKDGEWREYSNGKLQRVHDYERGINAANSIEYGDDTTHITSVTSYFPNGETKLVIRYHNNKKEMSRWYYSDQHNLDSAINYYPTGRTRDAMYTSYTNDEGMTQFYIYRAYHANGKLQAKGYKHRLEKTGTWLLYDSLGRLQTSISYQENLPFGWFMAYHPNGKMKVKAYCYESITDTILVYDKNGSRVQQSNPNYSKTIAEVQAQFPEVKFRDPNNFPPDHKRKGVVMLGDSIRGEGKWSDVPAMFPGGNDSLNAFIRKHVQFPEPERRLSKEGEVHIKFLVEKDGTLSDIQIVKVVYGAPGFTKETMQLMRAMPKWTPAKTKGKIVRVYYTLPIRFSLD
jgi:TonB family protein